MEILRIYDYTMNRSKCEQGTCALKNGFSVRGRRNGTLQRCSRGVLIVRITGKMRRVKTWEDAEIRKIWELEETQC